MALLLTPRPCAPWHLLPHVVVVVAFQHIQVCLRSAECVHISLRAEAVAHQYLQQLVAVSLQLFLTVPPKILA